MDEAIALSFAVKPDVITIDDSLAGDDSWQLAAHLRATYPDLGIVILSADGSDQTLFRALEVGASAFVAKSSPIQDVVAAIRGAAVAPSSFAAAGLAVAMRRKREATSRMSLSPRESEILFLLHDGLSVPGDRRPALRQPLHRQDLRGAPVRQARRPQPGPGAHDRDAARHVRQPPQRSPAQRRRITDRLPNTENAGRHVRPALSFVRHRSVAFCPARARCARCAPASPTSGARGAGRPVCTRRGRYMRRPTTVRPPRYSDPLVCKPTSRGRTAPGQPTTWLGLAPPRHAPQAAAACRRGAKQATGLHPPRPLYAPSEPI